uniref:Uncharacterized protein n=1 Tax=Rhizophora mucronata TaxID=61149 RepID=A0A2P2LND6_RHIMU
MGLGVQDLQEQIGGIDHTKSLGLSFNKLCSLLGYGATFQDLSFLKQFKII